LEVFVEEPSCEAALQILIPKIVPAVHVEIRVFQGKMDLLAKLPARLRGAARALPAEGRLLVIVDCDEEDCRQLKTRLDQAARNAGLRTRRAAKGSQTIQVLNRIAVEELEAWFIGDVPALTRAFPEVSPSLAAKARFRDPDAVRGGTAEALGQVLKQAYPAGLAKVDAARRIAPHMDPAANRSHSFNCFRTGVIELVG
jgi:hypothetical protein